MPRTLLAAAVAALLVSSADADSLLRNAASGYAVVPDKSAAMKMSEPVMRRVEDENHQPRHRWVFVKAGDGFLIKSASTGQALVPVFATRNERHGKLTLAMVRGEGKKHQRWRFAKTRHGYLIQNFESGLSMVPIREEAAQDGGRLVLFRVEDEENEGGLPDQNWRIVTFGPDK